ncbi:MAG: BlaI/MecI/CopY family transcriptional regulator [Tepidisphaerales bacterium]
MEVESSPTERELEILKVLWELGEASVREVYEALAAQRPVVQNTVQAFLRTMEEKGLVTHRADGRTFIYQPVFKRRETEQRLVWGVLQKVFDGAVDQMVQSALSLKKPSAEELDRLEALIKQHKAARRGKQVGP